MFPALLQTPGEGGGVSRARDFWSGSSGFDPGSGRPLA